jgi:hypothetical protein
MKLLSFLLLALAANASWFTSDKPGLFSLAPNPAKLTITSEYTSWDDAQLTQWLEYHSIKVPKGYNTQELQDLVKANWARSQEWTSQQYSNAQKVFQDTKSDAYKEFVLLSPSFVLPLIGISQLERVSTSQVPR